MAILKMHNEPKETLIRITKKDDGVWQIEVGPWYENGKPWVDIQNFLTKEEILMNKQDLKQFANEIRRIINEKVEKSVFLDLSFQKNEPQFKIKMCCVNDDYPLLSLTNKGKFEFNPSININYLTRGYGREEDQYLYENGGQHEGLTQYYKEDELNSFVENIEKEISL